MLPLYSRKYSVAMLEASIKYEIQVMRLINLAYYNSYTAIYLFIRVYYVFIEYYFRRSALYHWHKGKWSFQWCYDCSRKYSCNLRLACDLIFFYVGCKSQRFHNIRSYINLTTKNIFLYDKHLTSWKWSDI